MLGKIKSDYNSLKTNLLPADCRPRAADCFIRTRLFWGKNISIASSLCESQREKRREKRNLPGGKNIQKWQWMASFMALDKLEVGPSSEGLIAGSIMRNKSTQWSLLSYFRLTGLATTYNYKEAFAPRNRARVLLIWYRPRHYNSICYS